MNQIFLVIAILVLIVIVAACRDKNQPVEQPKYREIIDVFYTEDSINRSTLMSQGRTNSVYSIYDQVAEAKRKQNPNLNFSLHMGDVYEDAPTAQNPVETSKQFLKKDYKELVLKKIETYPELYKKPGVKILVVDEPFIKKHTVEEIKQIEESFNELFNFLRSVLPEAKLGITLSPVETFLNPGKEHTEARNRIVSVIDFVVTDPYWLNDDPELSQYKRVWIEEFNQQAKLLNPNLYTILVIEAFSNINWNADTHLSEMKFRLDHSCKYDTLAIFGWTGEVPDLPESQGFVFGENLNPQLKETILQIIDKKC